MDRRDGQGGRRVTWCASSIPSSVMDAAPRPYLSLVIPAYNEEEVVPALLARVEASLRTIGPSTSSERSGFEVIIIDDGSTDATPRLLADAMKDRPWLRVLRMRRNAGQ